MAVTGDNDSEHYRPGWLEKNVNMAVATVRANYDNPTASRHGINLSYPVFGDDAEELANRLSARFQSWTGKTLEQHFAAKDK